LDEYIEPALHIIDNKGVASSCACFDRDKRDTFGNIFNESLEDIIKKVNSNEFYRIVSKKGTNGILNLMNSKSEISNLMVTNRHEACYKLKNIFDTKFT